MLSRLHEGHQGILKTKLRAKSLLFWPNINSEIENLILACPLCEQYRSANIKEPLQQHEIPARPFMKVACDIGELGNGNFLIL